MDHWNLLNWNLFVFWNFIKNILGFSKHSICMMQKYLPVSLTALIFYFFIVFGFNYHNSFEDIVFCSVDARGYQQVANWIWGKLESTPYTELRPFMYPLVMGISQSLMGNAGIWMIQGLFWFIAVLLLFSVVLHISHNKFIAYFTSLLLIVNISSIVLTLHGLSETLTLFLVCVYIYILFHKERFNTLNYWCYLLLASSFLTCTRPVFQFLMIFTLCYSVIHIFIKNRNLLKKYILYLLIGLFPVMVQLSIVKINHGEWKISERFDSAIRYHYYSRLKSKIDGISIADARKIAANQSKNEIYTYIFDHPKESFNNYKEILLENLKASSSLSKSPTKHEFLIKFSIIMNGFAYYLHIIMFFLLILTTIIYINDKRSAGSRTQFETIIFLAIPMYVNLLSSGLVFCAGDRIILPSQPLWIVLYTFTIILLVEKYKKIMGTAITH